MMTFIGQEGKLLPSFQLALPSRSQTFSRIYLTSSAFVRPCSMCYVCCCGGAAAAVLVFVERMRKGIRRRCFEGASFGLLLLLRSEEIYPLFPPERQMQSRYGQASGRTTDGRRKQSLRSIYRQSNARRQMAARCSPTRPVTCVIHNTVSSDSAHFPFSVSQSSLG